MPMYHSVIYHKASPTCLQSSVSTTHTKTEDRERGWSFWGKLNAIENEMLPFHAKYEGGTFGMDENEKLTFLDKPM